MYSDPWQEEQIEDKKLKMESYGWNHKTYSEDGWTKAPISRQRSICSDSVRTCTDILVV